MPKANWGISAADVDDFDRESRYKPYDGPIPVNGVKRWKVKRLTFIAATGTKKPQLRVGLELIPRTKEEKPYAGYYITAFLPVTPKTTFRYVPFLDAIGVSGREFENGTITDEEGHIKKIGRWRFTDDVHIMGELKDDVDGQGNPRKDIGWMGADTGAGGAEDDIDDSEEDYGDDEYAEEGDYDDDWG